MVGGTCVVRGCVDLTECCAVLVYVGESKEEEVCSLNRRLSITAVAATATRLESYIASLASGRP